MYIAIELCRQGLVLGSSSSSYRFSYMSCFAKMVQIVHRLGTFRQVNISGSLNNEFSTREQNRQGVLVQMIAPYFSRLFCTFSESFGLGRVVVLPQGSA